MFNILVKTVFLHVNILFPVSRKSGNIFPIKFLVILLIHIYFYVNQMPSDVIGNVKLGNKVPSNRY